MQPRDVVLQRSRLARPGWGAPNPCVGVAIIGAVIIAASYVHGGQPLARSTLAPQAVLLPVVSGGSPVESTQGVVEAAAAAPVVLPAPFPPPAAAVSDALVQHALPNCSVVFFHHLEKTAGTTLRSILQRHAQLGLFDFFSFVNRFNKLQLQLITHRLDQLRATGQLDSLRLAVEIHIGGGGYEHFLKYTLPDLLLLRSKLRRAGCRCNLVSLLRHPVAQHISWHHHFVDHRVPLCFWTNPYDCQTRMAMALACHGGPTVRPLTNAHERAVSAMWERFDLVGVTERFDEFLVILTDLVGLQRPEYRSQIATKETIAAREATQQWTSRGCAHLTREPPPPLLKFIRKRMEQSAASAARFMRAKGRADSRGPPGMMDCAGYGPCQIPGVPEVRWREYRWFDQAQCANVSSEVVLARLCERMPIDESLYLAARAAFDAMAQKQPTLAARVEKLRAAGAVLERRAAEQARADQALLARSAGSELQHQYVIKTGSGPPWKVDEFSWWYRPHERARFSCANCSGDVVPEFDLVGCWPLWPQFGPDELAFRCARRWTADPGLQRPRDYLLHSAPLPCWQTCWTPLPPGTGQQHCTAPCPAKDVESAVQWRARWDQELAEFNSRPGPDGGLELALETKFVTPLHNVDSFIWNVV
ncbi:hypothetical protein AB1Y20_017861 [Prymnesium parvum]|uniref:Uncharacterized protein n=1 Tax=Prymnesium parvum TaxID=97485 RepID=A0AB34JN97_PRYPA